MTQSGSHGSHNRNWVTKWLTKWVTQRNLLFDYDDYDLLKTPIINIQILPALFDNLGERD